MKPLFPDKDKLVIDAEKSTKERKRYIINEGCRWRAPQLEATGNKTVAGDYYDVPTDAGPTAVVWVANDPTIDEDLKYFCHGHSFGTYEEFGYSIAQIDNVTLAEWKTVGTKILVERKGLEVSLSVTDDHTTELREALSGEPYLLAIAWTQPGTFDNVVASLKSLSIMEAPPKIIHSFRVTRIPSPGSLIDADVSSKNTFGPLDRTNLRSQLSLYTRISGFRLLKRN